MAPKPKYDTGTLNFISGGEVESVMSLVRCLDATEGCGSQTSFLDPGRVSIGKLQCKGQVDEVVSMYVHMYILYMYYVHTYVHTIDTRTYVGRA